MRSGRSRIAVLLKRDLLFEDLNTLVIEIMQTNNQNQRKLLMIKFIQNILFISIINHKNTRGESLIISQFDGSQCNSNTTRNYEKPHSHQLFACIERNNINCPILIRYHLFHSNFDITVMHCLLLHLIWGRWKLMGRQFDVCNVAIESYIVHEFQFCSHAMRDSFGGAY